MPPRAARTDASPDPVRYRSGRPGLESLLLRLVSTGAVIMAIYHNVAPDKAYSLAGMVLLLGLCIRSVAAGVGSISTERENGTLEPLLTTRLTPTELLSAKLAAVVAQVRVDWLVCVLFAVIPACGPDLSVREVGGMVLLLTASAAFYTALAVWCSSYARTTLSAGLQAFGMLGFLCLVTFWIDMPLTELLHHDWAFTMWANPLMGQLGLTMHSSGYEPLNWIWLVCSLVYLSAIPWLLTSARRHLQQTS